MEKTELRDLWLMFQRDHDGVSVDRMVCDPDLRGQFIAAAQAAFGGPSEQEILWALMGLRKTKTLPATLRP